MNYTNIMKRLKINIFRGTSKRKNYSEGKGKVVTVHAMKEYRSRKGRDSSSYSNLGTR
jgi:hypothetical protein